MISYTAYINRTGNNTNNHSATTINVTSPIVINDIALSVVSARTQEELDLGADSHITFNVSHNGTTVYSETRQLTIAAQHDEGLSLTNPISCAVGDTVAIWTTNKYFAADYVQWGNLYVAEPGFYIQGQSDQSSSVNNMIVDYDYAEQWTLDGQNEGYPYPTGTDPTRFIYYDKDSAGYPKNRGVWKLDDQNEGYPWIVGYEQTPPMGGALLLYENGQAVPVNFIMYENGAIVPVGIMLYERGV